MYTLARGVPRAGLASKTRPSSETKSAWSSEMKRTAFYHGTRKTSQYSCFSKKKKESDTTRWIRTYACHWGRVFPSTLYANSVYELSQKENKERAYVRKVARRLRRMRGLSPKYVLCHEHVVHTYDVNLVNAIGLELVVIFDVSRRLRMTRGREGSRHANLYPLRILSARKGRARKKASVSLRIFAIRKNIRWGIGEGK